MQTHFAVHHTANTSSPPVNTCHTLHISKDLEMPDTINCAVISLAISVHVRPSARNKSTAAKKMFIKFHICKYYKITSPLCRFCIYLSIKGAVIKSYTGFCVRVSSNSLPIHSTEVGNTLRLLLARCNTTNKRVSIEIALQSTCKLYADTITFRHRASCI